MDAVKNKGKLFIISGPSGTGKGTICKKLVEETDIEISVSMTTRAPREGEIDGVSYHFTTKENFQKTVEEGGLLEYAQVYGNFYGTPKAKVIEKLEEGIDVLLEIDVQGALNVKETYPEGISIFVLPPSIDELKKRIIGRASDSEEAIKLRLSQALKEISFVDKYDYYVVNDNLEDAVLRVLAIVDAERSKVSEDIYKVIENYKEEI